MAVTLLPCPFCGGRAMMGGNSDVHRYFIYCEDCHCSIGENYDAYGDVNHKFGTRLEAIKAWNKRITPEGKEK